MISEQKKSVIQETITKYTKTTKLQWVNKKITGEKAASALLRAGSPHIKVRFECSIVKVLGRKNFWQNSADWRNK